MLNTELRKRFHPYALNGRTAAEKLNWMFQHITERRNSHVALLSQGRTAKQLFADHR